MLDALMGEQFVPNDTDLQASAWLWARPACTEGCPSLVPLKAAAEGHGGCGPGTRPAMTLLQGAAPLSWCGP